MMTDADIAAVRMFEKVIDNGYRNLPIFALPLDVALYGLLSFYDSNIITQMVVRQNSGGASLTTGQVQLFKSHAEGLVWAARWLMKSEQRCDVKSVAEEDVIAKGHQITDYGAKYFLIGMMYSHFSRGTAEATGDIEKKIVRFVYTPAYHRMNSSWGFHDDVSNDISIRKTKDLRRLDAIKLEAKRAILKTRHHLEDGRIVFDHPIELNSPSIQAWCAEECLLRHIFPSDVDLGEFTVSEFNSFWQALFAWSISAAEIYISSFENGIAQETCMPTQIVPRDQFIETICALSALSKDVASRIIAKMAFDWRTTKPDVFLQPLFCGGQTVAWSPTLVQQSRFQRNLLKLMARTPGDKNFADKLIGDREHQLLNDLQKILESKGWSVILNKRFLCGEEAEVDLIAATWRHPHEVLIVEAKAFLQVDDMNEIKSATIEMQRAQTQVDRIMRLLRTLPNIEKQRLFPGIEWNKVERFWGIIVTPETEPGINFDHSTVPAASLLTLRAKLRSRDWAGPCGVWDAMVKREWQSFLRNIELFYEPTILEGITFELPYINLPQ